MRIIRTEKQKDNLAKAFWDMGKVTFSILVISPLARHELAGLVSFIVGTVVGLIFWIIAYLLDAMEVKP